MKRRQVNIFATRTDLAPGIASFESQEPVKYVEIKLRIKPVFEEYESLLDVASLGTNTSGDHISGAHYLIVPKTHEIKFESVPQRNGGMHYFVSQLLNPGSITFLPGGVYKNQFLVCGHLGTSCDDTQSIRLHTSFSKVLTKEFKKIGNYKVGPEALQLMDQGVRMITISVKEPEEYDLRRT